MREPTSGALRMPPNLARTLRGVTSRRELRSHGIGPDTVTAQVRAARWQLLGDAVVLHNGPVSLIDRRRAALISCGRRAALTSFTAGEVWGLRGWERAEI